MRGTKMDQYRIDFASFPWNSQAPGVRFKVHKRLGTQLRVVEFTREFVEADWCTRGHIGSVLEGSLEIDFQGTPIVFNAGEGLSIEPGRNHQARVVTDCVRLVLVEEA